MKMPNAAEMIDKNAREAEARKILDMARKCETLEEFIEKLESMLEG